MGYTNQSWLIVVVALVATSIVLVNAALEKCLYGETRLFVHPHCVPYNKNVTIKDNWPYCGDVPCHALIDEKDVCPQGSVRGSLKTVCVQDCQPPKIILRAKPYCVTNGCEDNATFAFCVTNQLKKVLDSDKDRCPEGSQRGNQEHICFDEDHYVDNLCGPGDREHLTNRLPTYCVPNDFEKNILAPLQRMVPTCGNGRPCLQLNRMMRQCPTGTQPGKRRLQCNVLPDVITCGMGYEKFQVPRYCYPDSNDFQYSPYCSK